MEPARTASPRRAWTGTARSTPATRTESLHLLIGAGGAAIGLLVGLLALRGTAPLAGTGSIGQVTALSVAGCAAAATALTIPLLTARALPWFQERRWWRRAVDVIALSLIIGLLGLLLTGAVFTVIQQAFLGVAFDRMTGTFLVAAASGAAAFAASAAAAALNGRVLATLLALFLTAGVLTSAMNAPDPYWWERYFSELGEGDGIASYTFNVTLLLTGIALLTVTEFLAHDLQRWASAAREPRWKVTVVRWMLSAVGLLVSGVALVSRTVSVFWHDVLAQSLVVVFGLALLVFPLLLRRLPGGLLAVTGGAFALLVTLIVLYTGVGYLNMTAFEIGAAVVVYVWLLLFIRLVAAAAEGAVEPDAEAARDAKSQTESVQE